MKDVAKTGWDVKPLGEVCAFQGGTQPPKSQFVDTPREGYVRLLQIRDFKSDDRAVYVADNGKVKKCEADDIMIGRYGASVGQIHRGKSGAYNVALVKTIPDDRRLDRDYFYYYLTSDLFQKPLMEKSSRGAQDGFNQGDIAPFPVPLPPLEEQQRIVAVLDEAFEGLARARAHAEANLQNARELFGSELASVCMTHAEQYGTVSLAELSEEITDGDHMPPPKAQEGVPFVTIKNIDKERHDIDFSDTFKVPEIYYQELKDKRKPRVGDVLYTVTGSFGIPVLIQAGQRFCFQRHIGLIRPRPSISPEWLYFVLLSPFVFEQADAGATGTAQRTVSLKLLRSMTVPSVPPKLQTEIAARFRRIHSEASRLAICYQARLQDLDDLRQSLLQKAFAGELTQKIGEIE